MFGNTTSGVSALGNNTSGSYNVAIGASTLYNVNGASYNTAVGYIAGPMSNNTNTGAFGYGARPNGSNTIVLGNNTITKIGGYANWTNLSDARFKTDVKANVPGLEFITKLRPVTFKWDLDKLNAFDGIQENESNAITAAKEAKKSYSGFLAQDVERAADQCDFDFSGVIKPDNPQAHYQLAYAEFVVPLVRAVQQQQTEIEELRATVKALSSGRLSRNEVTPSGVGVSRFFGEAWGPCWALLGTLLALAHVRRSKDGAPGRRVRIQRV
jgi:trimeric autotransporter adhesin